MTGEFLDSDDAGRLRQLWQTVNGDDGQSGLRKRIEVLEVGFGKIEAIDATRQKNHEENRAKSNLQIALLLVIVGFLGVTLTLIGMILKHL